MKLNKKFLSLFILFAIIIFFVSGCQKNNTKNTTQNQKIPSASGSSFLMDTLVQMKAYGENAQEDVDESLKRLDKLEKEMSTTIKTSQIYKINSHPGQDIKVDPDTFKVIQKALDYAQLTNGRFDPSIGPLVQLWGINTDHAKVPTQKEIDQTKKLINYKWVKINPDQKTVKLTKKGMMLDLGAIAKGYAADEVRNISKKLGIKSAFVNLGGNVLVIGSKPDGSPWNVGIRDPRIDKNGVVASIKVRDKTIVTSGNYERYFKKDGIIYHHILDPITGRPARNGIISATIVTNDSFDADALSTSLFILGTKKGLKLIESIPDVEAMIIKKDKSIILSSGLKGRVHILNSEFYIKER